MKKSLTTVLVAVGLLAVASLLTTQAYAESAPPFEERWAQTASGSQR